MLKIDEFKIYEDLSENQVIEKALKKNHIANSDVIKAKITKKSIDARDKEDVHYSYALEIEVTAEDKYPKMKKVQAKKKEVVQNLRNSIYPPVIIGAGPAGLFCALKLVDNGVAPIIIEQGDSVEKRQEMVSEYRKSGKINPRSNVQFGEGGAGAFSDGKLTTGISSGFIQEVTEQFYKFGAPKEVTYLSKPHIGTDNLMVILKNIRHYIEDHGGKYYFNTKFQNYRNDNGIITVECENRTFTTDTLVLAIGHSARETFQVLKKHDLEMTRKIFSVGVRIEHLQKAINEAQYGTKTKLKLPPADYKLVYHDSERKRSCYSFCMCPGGVVMASASEEGHIVTNGMSEFARDKENANAALLVNVYPEDLNGDDIMAGFEFQAQLEKKAYQLAGNNGNAPVQRVEDFEKNRVSTAIGKVVPSYKPGYSFADLNELLPDYVSQTLKDALPYFDKKIKGYNDPDAILTAVETRTSSPVTIVRDENCQCEKGVYPCGEGAGYAGGITSAAIDGIKIALKILAGK